MATLVIPEHFQVGIEMVCSGRTIMNVLGFKDLAGGGGADPAAALTVIKEAWEKADGPLKIRSNRVSMVGYHYTSLNTADAPTAFLGSGAIGAGIYELSMISSCAVVKLSGASRARSKNGRLFHGPIMENDMNDDGRTIKSAYLDAVQLAYFTFQSDMEAAAFPWSILSRKNSEGTLVVGTSASPILGSQHRRLR